MSIEENEAVRVETTHSDELVQEGEDLGSIRVLLGQGDDCTSEGSGHDPGQYGRDERPLGQGTAMSTHGRGCCAGCGDS